MKILTIRTDNPQAEIGLFEDKQKIDYEAWHAHRELAETIHNKIRELLSRNGLEMSNIEALACYEGPGSFTGLRIGLSVANAIASSLGVKVASGSGDEWQEHAIQILIKGEGSDYIVPNYGAPVFTTKPKK